jgi:hypothetical protein
MVHPVPKEDFRSTRWVLDPDDFALSSGKPDPPPSDLVAKDVWSGIIDLPTDVSIRTSDHHGSLLAMDHRLWESCIDMLDQLKQKTPLFSAVLDAADEFQACTFNALHGFCRPAIGCLRSVLDLTLTGLCCELAPTRPEVQAYLADPQATEIPLGAACDLIAQLQNVKDLEAHLEAATSDTLFQQKNQKPGEGWVRRLYGILSKYSHSRAGRTSGDMWQSNGPVFVSPAFRRTTLISIEVAAVMCLLIKIGRPSFSLPAAMQSDVFQNSDVKAPQVAEAAYRFVFR